MALADIRDVMAAISDVLLVSPLGSGNATAANSRGFGVIAVVGSKVLSSSARYPFFQQVVRGLIVVIAVSASIQAIKRSLSRNKG